MLFTQLKATIDARHDTIPQPCTPFTKEKIVDVNEAIDVEMHSEC